MHHFDWSGIPAALPTLWTGAIITFKITLIAIVFGIVWGTILAMFRLSSIKPLEWFAGACRRSKTRRLSRTTSFARLGSSRCLVASGRLLVAPSREQQRAPQLWPDNR